MPIARMLTRNLFVVAGAVPAGLDNLKAIEHFELNDNLLSGELGAR